MEQNLLAETELLNAKYLDLLEVRLDVNLGIYLQVLVEHVAKMTLAFGIFLEVEYKRIKPFRFCLI